MRSNRFRLSLSLLAAFLLAPVALAQGTGAQSASDAEDRYVSQKGFGNRIFEVRHRDPQSVARVLGGLGSGFRGAVVSPNQEFRTITVRDFPENIAAIEEALRRLDAPEPPRPGVEFQVYLLLASNDPAAQSNLPAELNEAAAGLRSTLGYRTLSLMGTQVVRSKDRSYDAYNKGIAELRPGGDAAQKGSPVYYNYSIRSVSLAGEPGRATVRAEEFSLNLRVPVVQVTGGTSYEEVGFKNPVLLREGERVVVGSTSVGDKSVVVMLTAKAGK